MKKEIKAFVRKTVSGILTLSMLASLAPGTVFAATATDTDATDGTGETETVEEQPEDVTEETDVTEDVTEETEVTEDEEEQEEVKVIGNKNLEIEKINFTNKTSRGYVYFDIVENGKDSTANMLTDTFAAEETRELYFNGVGSKDYDLILKTSDNTEYVLYDFDYATIKKGEESDVKLLISGETAYLDYLAVNGSRVNTLEEEKKLQAEKASENDADEKTDDKDKDVSDTEETEDTEDTEEYDVSPGSPEEVIKEISVIENVSEDLAPVNGSTTTVRAISGVMWGTFRWYYCDGTGHDAICINPELYGTAGTINATISDYTGANADILKRLIYFYEIKGQGVGSATLATVQGKADLHFTFAQIESGYGYSRAATVKNAVNAYVTANQAEYNSYATRIKLYSLVTVAGRQNFITYTVEEEQWHDFYFNLKKSLAEPTATEQPRYADMDGVKYRLVYNYDNPSDTPDSRTTQVTRPSDGQQITITTYSLPTIQATDRNYVYYEFTVDADGYTKEITRINNRNLNTSGNGLNNITFSIENNYVKIHYSGDLSSVGPFYIVEVFQDGKVGADYNGGKGQYTPVTMQGNLNDKRRTITYTDQQAITQTLIDNPADVKTFGIIGLKKTSSSGRTDVNFTGTVYGVYGSEADAKNGTNLIKKLTLNSENKAYGSLDIARATGQTTVYIKELSVKAKKISTGEDISSQYLVNTAVKKVTVQRNGYQYLSADNSGNIIDFAPVFNADYYYNRYPDLQTQYNKEKYIADTSEYQWRVALFTHFIQRGMNEFRHGSADFDIDAYYNITGYHFDTTVGYRKNVDANAGRNVTLHYLENHEYIKPEVDESEVKYVTVMNLKNNEKVYVSLKKASSKPACTDGNPNYDLTGATYKIYKTEAEAKKAFNDNDFSDALGTLTVKKDGTTNMVDVSKYMDTTSTGVFDETRFFVVESKAGKKNYLRSDKVGSVLVTAKNTASNPAVVSVKDDPVNDPFSIEIVKEDKDGNIVDADLSGAKFKINFYPESIATIRSADWLKTNGTPSSAYSAEIETTEVGGKYIAKFQNNNIPVGFITISEITPPDGYSLEGAEMYLKGDESKDISSNPVFVTTAKLTNNETSFEPYVYYPWDAATEAELATKGELVDVTGTSATVTIVIKDQNTRVRGNLALTKVDEDDKPLEGVKFEVKNDDTGEVHYIYTDKDGKATTVTDTYDNVNYYDDVDDYDGTASIIWFEKFADGTVATPLAGKGAVVPGNYTVTEKRCKANKGLQLEDPIKVVVPEDINEGDVINISDKKVYNLKQPEIGTSATVKETGDKLLPMEGPVTVVDEVEFSRLREDTTYVLVGTLMVKEADGTAKAYQKDGKDYSIEHVFTTEKGYDKSRYEKNGKVTMNFTDVYPEEYANKDFVVFEKLYLAPDTITTEKDKDIFPVVEEDIDDSIEYQTGEDLFPVTEEDINNKNQTVHVGTIGTTATVQDSHVGSSLGSVTIQDKVHYKSLILGKTYTIKGKLYFNDGTVVKNTDGSEVTAEKTFVAEKTDGYEILEFVIDDASVLEGKTTIVFEDLFYENRKIATHSDLKDEDQTIYFPKIKTTATSDGEKTASSFGPVTITDVVEYTNLIIGKSYTVSGKLYFKDDGTVVKNTDGSEVTAEKTFIAETSDGYVTLEFVIDDASVLMGKTTVVFEDMFYENRKIATHSDLTDEDQSVYFPKIGTTATFEGGKKTIHLSVEDGKVKSQTVTVIDTVAYSNFTPGKYKFTGVLMDKATGKEIEIDGKKLTAETTVDITAPSGSVDVKFTFDVSKLVTSTNNTVISKDLVVYEEALSVKTGKIKAVHKDLNDKGQTITVTTTPKTGDMIPLALIITLLATALIGAGVVLVIRKKINR